MCVNNEGVYVSPAVGNQITAIFKKIALEHFAPEYVRQALRTALAKENFTIAKLPNGKDAELVVVFDNPIADAATIMECVMESSADVHCYIEHRSLVLRIYTCRSPKDGHIVFAEFKKFFPESVVSFLHETNIDIGILPDD